MLNKIFAYGTLRHDHINSRFDIIEDKARLIGEGSIKGTLLDLGEYPGLLEYGENRIKGYVYEIKDIEDVIRDLDEYEGCDESLFIRKERDIILDNGEAIKAWVYFFNEHNF